MYNPNQLTVYDTINKKYSDSCAIYDFTFIDLFAGIGGFHQAAGELGGRCVFACDIDKYARDAYFANYKLMPHGDITKISTEDIPDHDILFAGFPCQPFSIIGEMKGFTDTRGTLFFEIARILSAKRPNMFVLENVKQLNTLCQREHCKEAYGQA